MTKVAIYDSGVGGLSIFQEIVATNQSLRSIFVSDNQAYPYGTKPEAELLRRVLNVSDAICDQYQPDVLVLACNTASTVCLPKLRQRLSLPVVGVVPAIKPAASVSQTKNIGLLATPATVHRAYTDELIADFASHCTVTKVGSKELVDMAEAKLAGQAPDMALLKNILQPFIDQPGLDTLVLACTHFPLLKQEIAAVLSQSGVNATLIDSGSAIASRVLALVSEAGKQTQLVQQNQQTEYTSNAGHIAAFTDKASLNDDIQKNVLNMGFTNIEALSV